MLPVFLAPPWQDGGHSLNFVSLAVLFISSVGGFINRGKLKVVTATLVEYWSESMTSPVYMHMNQTCNYPVIN